MSEKPKAAGSPPPTPRWVKVSGAVFITLVLLFLIAHALGGGMGGH